MKQLRNTFFRAAAALLILLSAGQMVKAQTGAVPCPANLDFSFNNFNNWQCYTGDDNGNTGILTPIPNYMNATPPLAPRRHSITSGTGVDPYGLFPVVCPGGGLFSAKIGSDTINACVNRIVYHVHIPVGFNNYSFDYRYAMVLDNGGHHPVGDQPAFEVVGRDSASGNIIQCATHSYYVDADPTNNAAILQQSTVNANIYYSDWQAGNLNLSGYGGRTVDVEVTSYDCTATGHFGYGYFDVVACGRFSASVQNCNLKTGIVTLGAPTGYKDYKWYSETWSYIGNGRNINIPVPSTCTYFNCVMTPYLNSGGCYDTIRTRRICNFTINTTPKSLCNTLGRPVGVRTVINGGMGGWNAPGSISWLTASPFTAYTPGVVWNKDTIDVRPTGADVVLLTVTDSIGCYRRDTITIVNPNFHVNLGPDLVTCLGTNINLSPTLTPPSSGYIYTWTPGAHLSDSTILNPVYAPAAIGVEQLALRVDSSICAAADTINIRTLPNSFTVSDTAICQRARFHPNITGDTDYFHYVWSPINYPFIIIDNSTNGSSQSPLIIGDSDITYTIKAKYPTCPDIVRTMKVHVEPRPVVDLGADSVSKCLYEPIYLTANVGPAWFTNYTYSWTPNTDIDKLNSPLITFTGKKDTMLYVSVTTPLGCRGRDSIFVKVYQAGFGNVNPRDTAICPGANFRLHASGGVKYVWSPALYLSDTTGANIIANPGTSVDYTLYVTDKTGCVDTVPFNLHVYAQAEVSLPDSTVIYPGESFQMNPGGNALYYSWFPTVGLSSASIANPVASPTVNTLYRVTGTTEAGCVATDSMRVIVKEDAVVEMPNAFSPGSAPNAMFGVAHRGVATLKYLRVYNRWGVKVFETTNIDQGWDGRYNGEPQPMGVYVYTMEGTTIKGNNFNKTGNLTLIR